MTRVPERYGFSKSHIYTRDSLYEHINLLSLVYKLQINCLMSYAIHALCLCVFVCHCGFLLKIINMKMWLTKGSKWSIFDSHCIHYCSANNFVQSESTNENTSFFFVFFSLVACVHIRFWYKIKYDLMSKTVNKKNYIRSTTRYTMSYQHLKFIYSFSCEWHAKTL